MSYLAFDVGGANLKVADGNGYALSLRLPVWENPGQLEFELRKMIANATRHSRLAVTMTAELADCFESKSQGVAAVLDAVEAAASGIPVRVYRNDGRLVAPAVIRAQPLSAAATNWHALARFARRFCDDQPGMLIDVGSSTCDIIPLPASPSAAGDADLAGPPHASGIPPATDAERLASGQLLYLGVERTPVCSLLSDLPFNGGWCPVARELFATTLDVALLLKQIPEDPLNTHTADGRPATKVAARRRMSRMVCANDDEFNHRDAVRMASAVFDAQTALLTAAMRQVADVSGRPQRMILSGHGEHLARVALERCGWGQDVVSLAGEIGAVPSRCAPAHAVAVLANESLAP